MNSRSYFTARSLSTYGLTGSMKATLIRSRHLSDLAASSPESSDLSPMPEGSQSARPVPMSAAAVVASADSVHVALKPSARTSRCSGANWPPKEGCGQSDRSVQRRLPAAGTQASWRVPIRSRSRCADSGRAAASPSIRPAGSVTCRPPG